MDAIQKYNAVRQPCVQLNTISNLPKMKNKFKIFKQSRGGPIFSCNTFNSNYSSSKNNIKIQIFLGKTISYQEGANVERSYRSFSVYPTNHLVYKHLVFLTKLRNFILFTNFCKETFPTSFFQCAPLNDYFAQNVLSELAKETLL